MNSYLGIGFIFLAFDELIGQQVQQYCDGRYCYRTDEELKNITSLKEAQDYCYNNDSSSWLLEIYDSNQYFDLFFNNFLKYTFICNSIGTVANTWTSVINGQLPTGLTIDESNGQDFLYLNVTGEKLYFQGADKNARGFYICRAQGSCSLENCYTVNDYYNSWVSSGNICFGFNGAHLATFDGMSYDEISNLSFVGQLTENTIYWIGYSKLVYTLQHSNLRDYFLSFDAPYPLLTASHPNESYFVYYESGYFIEKPVGDAQFQIICMIDTLGLTSLPATPASVQPSTVVNLASSTTATPWNSFETNPTTAGLNTSNETNTTATKKTRTTDSPTSVQPSTVVNLASSTTATPWNSFETSPTTAGLKASNESNINVTKSTIILPLLLPILSWLLFAIIFVWCILPYCVRRNTRKEAIIP